MKMVERLLAVECIVTLKSPIVGNPKVVIIKMKYLSNIVLHINFTMILGGVELGPY